MDNNNNNNENAERKEKIKTQCIFTGEVCVWMRTCVVVGCLFLSYAHSTSHNQCRDWKSEEEDDDNEKKNHIQRNIYII